MTDHADLYLLLPPKEFVVVHLSRDKRIGTQPYGFRQQKSSRSATKGHLLYGAAQQLVGLDTLHTKLFLQQEHQVVGSYRLRKATNHAFASRDAFHLLLLPDEREVLETQLLSDLIVDAPTALSILVCIDTMTMPRWMALKTVRCT